MTEAAALLDATWTFFASRDVPNGLFIAALLTDPSTWSDRVSALLAARFGSTPASTDER